MSPSTPKVSPQSSPLITASLTLLKLYFLAVFLKKAYTIRLHAITEYGLVIHEFDPWFNFRATEYLDENGWEMFKYWFDYKSWYPLGRPVGTTIYPGLQITSVFIKVRPIFYKSRERKRSEGKGQMKIQEQTTKDLDISNPN